MCSSTPPSSLLALREMAGRASARGLIRGSLGPHLPQVARHAVRIELRAADRLALRAEQHGDLAPVLRHPVGTIVNAGLLDADVAAAGEREQIVEKLLAQVAFRAAEQQ